MKTLLLATLILAPLTEEICFRGWLFGGFRTRFHLPVAAIGAARRVPGASD